MCHPSCKNVAPKVHAWHLACIRSWQIAPILSALATAVNQPRLLSKNRRSLVALVALVGLAALAAGESDKRKVVEEHLTVFKEQVEAAQAYDPDVVNAHSCKDFFTPAMADDFFRRALAWQEEQGFDVLHETHRKAS